MSKSNRNRYAWISAIGALIMSVAACQQAAVVEEEVAAAKIPITTTSDEARELFLQGRELSERLRGTDAHDYFLQAVELDPNFASAHFLAGFTGSTAQEFWDHLGSAVAAAEGASEGERLLILAAEAGTKGEADKQKELLEQLVETYPDDERAHNALGGLHFGRQEWQDAIAHYERAIEINPDFSPPYNQKGYAHRALEEYDAAETAFQKYVELIPADPNPYDSYAELLMKTGRFEESITKYREALEQDEHFVASYVGIAHNQMFMGQMDEARATLDELAGMARNVGERRAAWNGKARSYLHQGDYDAALEARREMYALAEADDDKTTMAGDLNQMGDILLEAGRSDEAAASYAKSIEMMDQSTVSDAVKEGARRNILFDEGRVALVRGDLDSAREIAATHGELVKAKQVPFEMRQHHELMGMIALAEGDAVTAGTHLEQASLQNPRVLYLLAKAHQAQDNTEEARAYCEKAANFNGLNANYPYVRRAAHEMLAGM
jgi:tetratricopeptide (TPR) repeat protein